MRHFIHCYAYEGAYCSCGAEQQGGYTGDQPGPDMLLPAAPFALRYEPVTNHATNPDGHRYLSTGCLHGQHDYCQSNTGAAGTKIPAQCKFCAAPCICDCHTTAGEQR